MAIGRYRKKPVVVEAVQWNGDNVLEVYTFMHGSPSLSTDVAKDKWCDYENLMRGKDWHVKTLEDGQNGEAKHVASVGDWIIKGIAGEFYPCKPLIFNETYSPEDENAFSAPNHEARKHAVALRQCAIFAADVGVNIVKAMTDAADFLSAITPAPDIAAENERLRAALEKAMFALAPLYNAVFNDNGDMTVSVPPVSYEQCVAAYFAAKAANAALERKRPNA